ncbi:hypothetical protein M231_06412 [Tremella mesenterica]|uniref:Uncharacterized protein n=1 Tax=Tremella mesenterica TaxID=5217 RepID=A0A4Q1BDL4_TREME|nr:hypothetical protein M231_06412 [Tremella mesenterica]
MNMECLGNALRELISSSKQEPELIGNDTIGKMEELWHEREGTKYENATLKHIGTALRSVLSQSNEGAPFVAQTLDREPDESDENMSWLCLLPADGKLSESQHWEALQYNPPVYGLSLSEHP